MGSGKSFIGKSLANRLDMDFIDLDDYIEKNESRSVSTIFEDEGEIGFRNLETECLKKLVTISNNSDRPRIIALGGGTPCFNNNLQLIKNSGESIFLNVSPHILLDRLKKEKLNRPLISDLNEKQLDEFIRSSLIYRLKYYQSADHIVNGDELSSKVVQNLEEIITKSNRPNN
jgi:shikimate kinase